MTQLKQFGLNPREWRIHGITDASKSHIKLIFKNRDLPDLKMAGTIELGGPQNGSKFYLKELRLLSV